MKKRYITWITVVILLAAVSVAFACGKSKAEKAAGGEQKTYAETLNDFDWSRTCPAAGCRNRNSGAEPAESEKPAESE